MELPLVSVRCSTCGAFAEALAYGGSVGPLTQTTLVEHETCDLLALHSQLSAARIRRRVAPPRRRTRFTVCKRTPTCEGLVTTEELIEVLKQHPGKTVVTYRGGARGYETLGANQIDLAMMIDCGDNSWTGTEDAPLWPGHEPQEVLAL